MRYQDRGCSKRVSQHVSVQGAYINKFTTACPSDLHRLDNYILVSFCCLEYFLTHHPAASVLQAVSGGVRS